MKSRWCVAVLGSLVTLPLGAGLAAQATPPPTPRDSALERSAGALVDQLSRGEFAHAVEGFDATMAAELPADKLEAAWQALSARSGPYAERGAAASGHAGGYIQVSVPVRFRDGGYDVKVVYDRVGKVAGLFFMPEALPAVLPPGVTEHEVKVGSLQLPGTLTVPAGRGPFPAVVLVQGSGPNDRDETIGPNKPFRDLAWGLAATGVEVLRYEKRTRAHPAAFAGRTFTVDEETVDDALAAVELLRRTPGVDPHRVVVLGHSLGATMAPRIGERDTALAGLVLLAAAARPLPDLMEEQFDYLAALPGPDSAARVAQIAAMRGPLARVRALTPADSASLQPLLGAPPSYWLDLEQYHPVAVARSLKMPLLILQGGRDYQVSPEHDFAAWKQGLAGHPGVTFREFPTLNHLFIAGTGRSTPAEYATPGRVDPAAIATIADWVKALRPR